MRADCYVAMKDLFKAVGDVRPLTKLIPDNTGAYLQLSHLYYVMGEADTSLKYVGFVPVLPAFILLRSSCALPLKQRANIRTSTLYVCLCFSEIRECLKLDPDHQQCYSHYKKVKKLVKQIDSVQTFMNEERWADCISKAEAMMQTEPEVHTYLLRSREYLCKCHAKVRVKIAQEP